MAQPASRSWKQGGPKADLSTDRMVRRWSVTLLGLLLVGLLVWVLYLMFQPNPKTHVIVFAADEYGKLESPALEFVGEDLKWLDELNQPFRRVDHPQFGKAEVTTEIRNLKPFALDSLLVYVIAQGVYDPVQKKACFVDPSRRTETGGSRMTPVADLLQAVAESPARNKLVVLDCQRWGVDARRGLYPNQFAADLTRELAKGAGKDVTVLMVGGPNEQASVLPDERRSLFGLAFERAIRKLNKPKTPLPVTALLTEIRAEMTHWLEPGQVAQSPRLLPERSEATLATLAFKPPPAAEKKEAPADDKAAKPAPPPAPPKPSKTLFTVIDEGWKQRDLLDSDKNPHWPSIYAPHQWQEILATLVDEESRLRGGENAMKRAKDEVPTLVAGLSSLRQAVADEDKLSEAEESPIARLQRAWNAYRGDTPLFRRWKQAADTGLGEQLDQQVFRAYARAVTDLPWMLDLADRLWLEGARGSPDLDVYRQQVSALVSAIGEFQRVVLAAPESPGEDALARLRDQLVSSRDALRQWLKESADRVEPQVEEKQQVLTLRDQRVLDATLRSPLWTLPERAKWRTLLVDCRSRRLDRTGLRDPVRATPKVLPLRAYEELISHLPQSVTAGSKSMADLQQRLPEIKQLSLPNWQVHNLLTLVDPREAQRYPVQKAEFLQLNLPVREIWDVKWPNSLIAAPLAPAKKTVTVELRQRSGELHNSVKVSLLFDDPLEILLNDAPVQKGTDVSVEVDENGRVLLDLTLQARVEQRDASSGKIRIQVKGADRLKNSVVDCRLPTERQVRLLADSAPLGAKSDAGAGDVLRVRLFPNRKTPWHFQVRNDSKDTRTLSVQFFAVPNDSAQPVDLTPELVRKLIDEGFLNRLDKAKPLYEVSSLMIPEGQVRDLIAPPPAAKANAPPPAAAPVAGPAPLEDVSSGLICVVREPGSTASPDVYGIGWDWIRPDQYVTATATFDKNRPQRSLLVKLALNTQGGLIPPDLTGVPIRLGGRLDRTIDLPTGNDADADVLSATLEDLITSQKPGGELSVNLPADNQVRRFVVDVDGWPRTFAFEADCRPANQQFGLREQRSSRLSSQVVSVQVSSDTRIQPEYFHPNARPEFDRRVDARAKLKLPPETPLPPLLLLQEAQTAPFQPGTRMTVRLELDFPQSLRSEEQAVLRRGTGQVLATFVADRRLRCRMQPMKDGHALFETQVEDWTIETPIAAQNQKDVLTLIPEGFEVSDLPKSSLELVLDSKLPRVTATAAGTPKSLTLRINAVDDGNGASGIDPNSVEAALSDRENPKKKEFEPALFDPRTNLWVQEFKIESPGRYFVFLRARDRAGNVSDPDAQPLAVFISKPSEPAPMTTAKTPAKIGNITGIVKYRDRPQSGVKVIAKGSGQMQRTDDAGKFVFRDLKIQAYTIEANGDVQNVERKGKLDGVMPVPKGEPAGDPIVVEIE